MKNAKKPFLCSVKMKLSILAIFNNIHLNQADCFQSENNSSIALVVGNYWL